ncbi:MAG: hypothetical protein LWW87_08520 [Geobacteraceae bacterium]|nr:hypothetical protein [Geobacteraceae bacterium]
MARVSFDEVVELGQEYRSTFSLSERKDELERIARDYSAKPLLVALMELLLTGDDVSVDDLKYLPEKFRVAQA